MINQANIQTLQPKVDSKIAEVLLPNEQHIVTIHQHIIVLIKYYLITVVGCAGFFLSLAILFKYSTVMSDTATKAVLLVVAAFTALVFSFVLFVVTTAYKQTVLVITNRSVVQIIQTGLLFHKVARLSMADVEDVSSEQKGILPKLFGYGSLTIETAGEEINFVFKYCVNPIHITEIILNARDQFNENNSE